MQPIISVVGKSESGKTTLLEALIPELQRRGHKVAVIKHTGNDYEFDTSKKDTWRFAQAGSAVSAVSSARRMAIFKKLERRFGPEEFSLVTGDCDLILTEGFKQASFPKIEVHRKEQGEGLLSPLEQLLAIVTDEPFSVNVPQFAPNEAPRIADLIEKRFMARQDETDVDLFINGDSVPVKPFFRDLLARTLTAMVSSIKDGGEVESLHISLRRKR